MHFFPNFAESPKEDWDMLGSEMQSFTSGYICSCSQNLFIKNSEKSINTYFIKWKFVKTFSFAFFSVFFLLGIIWYYVVKEHGLIHMLL